jgi:hypothetical protein
LIVGIIIAVVGGIPLCICGGCVATVYFGISAAIKASEPYQIAMDRASTNQEVIDALGEPIETGMFSKSNYSDNGGEIKVEATWSISGPKGSGTLRVRSVGNKGKWEHEVMEVDAGGKTIDLRDADNDPEKGNAGLGDIFKDKGND